MININLNDVTAATGANRPDSGGYIIQIMKATNNTKNERIDIDYDIAEGPFSGYYADLKERRNFWGGSFFKSYKEGALPYFKQFIEAVQKCNGGLPGLMTEDGVDETQLPGAYLGIVFGSEEYIGNDGRVKTRPDYFGAQFVSLDKIRNGEFEVPEPKKLDKMPTGSGGVVDTTAGFGPVTDDDTPF